MLFVFALWIYNKRNGTHLDFEKDVFKVVVRFINKTLALL